MALLYGLETSATTSDENNTVKTRLTSGGEIAGGAVLLLALPPARGVGGGVQNVNGLAQRQLQIARILALPVPDGGARLPRLFLALPEHVRQETRPLDV